jgi:hypothetical protein
MHRWRRSWTPMRSLPIRSPPRPLSLGQSIHSTDDDVGPQSTTVVTEGGDGPIRRHEQWQHIESLDEVESHEPGAGTDDLDDLGRHDWTVPRLSVNFLEAMATAAQYLRVSTEEQTNEN